MLQLLRRRRLAQRNLSQCRAMRSPSRRPSSGCLRTPSCGGHGRTIPGWPSIHPTAAAFAAGSSM
eukprot:926407-Lingulodinium_polyedra.AAC.1